MALKVYCMLDFDDKGEHYRCVIAAKSKPQAAKIFGCSMYHFNKYAAETRNAREIKAALRYPGRKIIMLGRG